MKPFYNGSLISTDQIRKTIIFTLSALGLGYSIISCSSKGQGLNTTANNQLPTSELKAAVTSQNRIAEDLAVPQYKHIFVIIEENKAFDQIRGNPDAPIINQLAQTYGMASNFFGEVHPSEANYIAMLGGSTFGIHDDAPYYAKASTPESHGVDHTIKGRSLLDQLEEKGLTWKGYFEDIPYPGYKGTAYPNSINTLYASKHNGFMNFLKVQNDPKELAKLVGINQLTLDLQSGNVPNYNHIVLNQCHEMHGLPQCSDTSQLIKTGDRWVGKIVNQITHSSLWSSPDNSAIVITWDEDNGSTTGAQGCCGYDPKSVANFGGGHILTIVMTNHGSHGVVDNTPYNHYSLLRTTEDAFGIHEYLNEAGNTKDGVQPMIRLFSTAAK
ncbi:MAG TPA: alkaline phosphatase family protein [Allocoleopsis sp.]